jgi:alkylhydroperoxidase/carboxymuconolactone decarboxylase family protein YurZ
MSNELVTAENSQLWLAKAVKTKKQLQKALENGETNTNEIVSMLASLMAYDKMSVPEQIEKKLTIKDCIMCIE